jgi:predicted hydrocarbon binding protein
MNYTKADMLQAEATMNQMRNAIYHLARFMEKFSKKDIAERLRRMGQNIAKTLFNYWKPVNIVTISNLKDVVSTIYQKILFSSVAVEIRDDILRVKDNDCAFCKYHYEDINIAGCEILLGFVSEFISLISKRSKDLSSIYLDPYNVEMSKSYGDSYCVQTFKIKKSEI